MKRLSAIRMMSACAVGAPARLAAMRALLADGYDRDSVLAGFNATQAERALLFDAVRQESA